MAIEYRLSYRIISSDEDPQVDFDIYSLKQTLRYGNSMQCVKNEFRLKFAWGLF